MVTTSQGALFNHQDRMRVSRGIVGTWLIADVLMQRKHEGDANDLSLRCVSTGPGVAMVASQNTYTYTHTKRKIT